LHQLAKETGIIAIDLGTQKIISEVHRKI